ncbi:hypothetical protein YM18_2528 [Geobacter sulfurreducens]|nr:hypothetical protein YM18_2528 [Geobacter sulfurreducens]
MPGTNPRTKHDGFVTRDIHALTGEGMSSLAPRLWVGIASAAVALLGVFGGAHALDRRFELTPSLLSQGGEAPAAPRSEGRPARKSERASAGITDYTVRPGDHIFKILMKEYGLSNREAETLIPEVRRINGITDIRRLRVGQTIRIPLGTAAGSDERGYSRPVARKAAVASGARVPAAKETGHLLRMTSYAGARETHDLDAARRLWDGLVAAEVRDARPIRIEDRNFSLSLDPENFPTFPAADGGRILVDADGKIPPLVRALIEEKEPSVRIVSENPRNRRRFLASLLEGAGFYSVEENVSLDFGADPKLTVTADFKVEKSPDSLLHNDVILLNVDEYRRGVPPALTGFLKREGFQMVEPFLGRGESAPPASQTLYQITASEPRDIADSLLRALNLRYDVDRSVELFGSGDGGVTLFVRADRYFENGGDRFVVSHFDGDPVSYTLTRLLETRGYRVIMLGDHDDFRMVAEKIFGRLRMPGSFARYDLVPYREAPYGIQMSGFRVPRSGSATGGFFTNAALNPLFRDLLDFNGYTIVSY